MGLRSYDRFVPGQDTLPAGGFGNLIALPLQKGPRERGDSVFLDEAFHPYPDQWAFLSTVQRIGRSEAEEIVRAAEARDRVVGVRLAPTDEDDDPPWKAPPSRRREPPVAGPLPQELELVLGDQIYIAKERLTPALRNRLLRLAAFQNPEFYRAQAMRQSTYGKDRIVACAEDFPLHIGLPRGCLEDVKGLLSDLKIEPVVRDERFEGRPLDVSFHGRLRPEQKAAAEAMVRHDIGVLSAATAFGKTAIAAWLIAKRRVNTLILVHRGQLADQWMGRLSTFLGLPLDAIGRIGGGKRKPNGMLDVALLQSVVREGVVEDQVGEYGHLIVDECHTITAPSFEKAARRAKAKFITGLSATVTRKDGRHPMIFMQCGPIRYRVDAKKQARLQPFSHTVLVRPTPFYPVRPFEPDPRARFHGLYMELVENEPRNRLILGDIVQAVREGRSPLVLTERKNHLERLAEMLATEVRHLIVLRGGMSRKELCSATAELASISDDEERVLLATGRYIGEGFDDARLDTLFLTLPVSWKGTIAQYAGRLHRLHDRKRDVRIYDYADLNVPMLSKMFDRRCRGYEAAGYTVVLPASALPGWPSEVELPIDPQWKKDYSPGVRRLVQDGVDRPLATLFAHAARPFPPDSEGADRARSAGEAFLFRRLETLPETAGKFRLSVELPIPFDGWGKMEVDLLCADAQLAIELDGAQHLSDPVAYRRDRRKDSLLQQNGYFVLRFLAEDVGARLDEILDTILQTLARRVDCHNK